MRRLLAGVVAVAALMPMGASRALASSGPLDPAVVGPLEVHRDLYDFGDTAFRPPKFPSKVEVRAIVERPKQMNNGPYPLVVFLHGRHSTCYSGKGLPYLEWPCQQVRQPIPSY